VARIAAPSPAIAMVTDFGYRDHYVGTLHGVIRSIAPATDVIDITHGIPPQSRLAGALALRESWRFFPANTIFLAVVDPTVGSTRRPIAIETRQGARFVGPDNGLLWMAASEAGIKKVVELKNPHYRLAQISPTFHGRDIFAPAAAWMSRGVKLASLGPTARNIEDLELAEPVVTDSAIFGKVEYVDSFGNLITNINHTLYSDFKARFPTISLWVTINQSDPIPIHNNYAEVSVGAPLALFGSFGTLELAIRDGTASEHFGCVVGAPVQVTPIAT
jgi:S-adenosylmethionine hydrolase